MGTVALVGLRSGALDAAERLGLSVAAVVESPPGPKTRARLGAVVEADFDGPPGAWVAAADALRPLDPEAVVALTERSVVPAAHLRAALGLDGLSVETARQCTDKAAMKRAARAAGLVCAPYVEADEGLDADALVDRLGLPLVLKRCVGSGSRGTHVVRDRAGMPDRLGAGWLAEGFVEGVEMSAELLVADGEALFFNPTQYLVPAWASVVPAPLPEADRAAVRSVAETAARAFGVTRGMTHLEVFLTPDGPVFGEMAARPPGGHLMTLIRHAYGVDPWEAVLEVERGERPALPEAPAQAAAVWILHPGAGTVREADGVEAAQALPGVEAVALRVAPGDVVRPRGGTGEEVGHVVVTGETAAEAAARVRAAREVLRLGV